MKTLKNFLNELFIDGLTGMAQGLFATLIIGTIICQIGTWIPNATIAKYLLMMGNVAKIMTGAGIGVGVATKLKASTLTTVSAAVVGTLGGFATNILNGTMLLTGTPIAVFASGTTDLTSGSMTFASSDLVTSGTGINIISGVGEPLGAFVAAYVAVQIGKVVSGRTKVDILITPFATIIAGSLAGLLVGPYISTFMKWLGELVTINVEAHPIVGGIVVSVLMGMFLTLPISSAAIGISMGLSGLAAGAATIGCCCQMVGFAVSSYKENRAGGLIAQGIGTSMLQVPNIVKNPLIWIPPIISSAILGPIAAAVLKMESNAVGSGMGSSGLVGQIQAFSTMTEGGMSKMSALIEIGIMHFILPAVITLAITEAMRKLKLIKKGDMLLKS
ncbi:MAG: PTS transporter subunit IIC [Eubacterium sp.]